MRYRSRSRYSSFWPPYVPVAERRAQTVREQAKLRKSNPNLEPVMIEGRTISRQFWGKGWCAHLESFGDYENRLPRGRTYVRNGSVCHLSIQPGKVDALVSGSSLYQVDVDIKPLSAAKWKALKAACTGRIGSLIELLQGQFSDAIMQTVTDRKTGLFPLPGEIDYRCNCPDWADMCKHIAAVMYGIGARLDTAPELLFTLRGVDHRELLDAEAAAATLSDTRGTRRQRRQGFDAKAASAIFDIDLDADGDALAAPTAPSTEAVPAPAPKPKAVKRRAPAGRSRKKSGPTHTPKAKPTAVSTRTQRASSAKPFKPTARSILRLRTQLGMSRSAFADAVGVSPATIANWESAAGPLKLQVRCLAGLNRLNR